MDVLNVLRVIDEDSDCAYDGYLDEDDFEGDFGAANEEEREQQPQQPAFDTVSHHHWLLEYQQQTGCSVDMSDKGPVDFFPTVGRWQDPDKMLEGICEQTNLYAAIHGVNDHST